MFPLQTSSPSGTLSPGCLDSEPASLAVGTEVSAKYKGAFCEAKIKCVTRLVKCRVTPKNGGSAIVVTDDNVKGPLRVGAIVEVRQNSSSSSSSYIEATVNKIMDSSQYTVIFDDGDETTLKRTSLCLKSGKHYSESESLDHLPLTNPEQFCNPVGLWPRKRRRPGERSSSNVPMYQNRDSASIPYSNPPSVSDEDSTTGTIDGDDDSASNLTQRSVAKDSKDDSDSLRKDETLDVGKVFIIEYGEKRGNKAKDVWYPALVVNPTTPENTLIKIDPEHEYLVKSFKDNKFYCVSRRDVKEFVQETYCSSLNDANSSAALRSAVDKSICYLDRGELPSTWDSDLLLGPFASSDSNVATHDTDTNYPGMASSESDSVADDECDDDKEKYEQPSELKDRFVAQLYKYMDERGTPINKAPSVNGKDLDLYRLFNIVHKMGGYNRVTSKDSWRQVYVKADLPSCPTQSLENNAVNQLKAAYKKYLLNFTDFYKKLGYSSSFISSPSSGRGHRRFGNWKGAASDANATSGESTSNAKSRRKSNTEVDVKTEPNDDSQESEKVRDDEDKSSTRRGSLKKQPKKAGPGRKKAPVKTDVAPVANDSDDGMSESVKTPGPSVESDTDSELSSVQSIGKDVEVVAGDKIRVRYKKGSGEHVYEAKILKAEKQVETGKMRFFVHYNGWNTRYDEWIYRSRIIEVIREKSPKRRSGNASNKFSKRAPPNDSADAADSKPAPTEQINTPKRGRPPSASGSRPPVDPNKSASLQNAKTAPKVTASSSSSSVSSKKLRSRLDQSDTEQSDSTTISKEEKCSRSETSSSEVLPEKSSASATSVDDSEAKHNSTERRSSVDSSIKQDSNSGVTKEESKSKKDSSSKDGKKDDSNDSADEEDVSKGSHKRKRKDKKTAAEDTPKKKTKGFRGTRSVKEEPAESEAPKSKERTSSFSSKKRKLESTQPASPATPAASATAAAAASSSSSSITSTTSSNAAATVAASAATPITTSAASTTVTTASSTATVANAAVESTEDVDCKIKRKGRGLTKESILRADAKHKAEAARKASEKTIKKSSLVSTEEDSRADDEDVNMEIARLFNEDKDKEPPSKKEVESTTNSAAVNSDTSPQTGQAVTCDPPEVSGSFLLCKEEVPLSPIPAAGFSENAEPEVSSSSSSKPSQAISSSVIDVNAPGASGSNNNGESNSANVQGNGNNTNNSSTNFTPPTTPESLRSGTLSSLTPPHERESQDMGHSAVKSQASHSASNSDGEAGDNRQKNSATFGSPAHLSDDSCSRGVTETNTAGPASELQGKKGKDAQSKSSANDGLTSSPKRKRRGRARTSSTSECNNQPDTSEKSKKPDKHAGYKTRGSSNKRGTNRSSGYHEHDRYSPIGSTSDHVNLHPISPVSGISPGDYTPNAFFKDIHPTSKYNFCTPIDETLDADRRILILNERICELRKTYISLRSDIQSLERRRKKLKRKDRSNGCSPRNESDRVQKTLDRSVSGEFSSDASDLTRPATEVNVG